MLVSLSNHLSINPGFFTSDKFLPIRLLLSIKQAVKMPLKGLTRVLSASQSDGWCQDMSSSNPCAIFTNSTAAFRICYDPSSYTESAGDLVSFEGFFRDDHFVPIVSFGTYKPCICRKEISFEVDGRVIGETHSVLSLESSGTSEEENKNATAVLTSMYGCENQGGDKVGIIITIVFCAMVAIVGSVVFANKYCCNIQEQREYISIQEV